MTLPTLYEIGQDIRALDLKLEELGGDVTGMEEQIDAWFAKAEGNLETKVNNYCRFIRNMEMQEFARRAESQRFAALADTDSNKIDQLRQRLKAQLQAMNRLKVETADFKVAVQNNGGQQSIETDGDAVPTKFMTYEPRVDYKAIRAALDDGTKLPFAKFRERGTHLRIK